MAVKDESPSSRSYFARVRRWRRVQVMGGFVLACCFFLPAVRSCNSNIIPASEAASAFSEADMGLVQFMAVFLVYVAAYLFGGLVAAMVVRNPYATVGGDRRRALFTVFFGALAGFALIATVFDVASGTTPELGQSVFWLLALLSAAYFLRSLRQGPAGVFCMRWYIAALCTIWFACWVCSGDALVGVYTSLAASLAILVAATGEAHVRTWQSVPATLRALLICRLPLYDLDPTRCSRCGYLLKGLVSPRCPECGLATNVPAATLDLQAGGPA